MPCLFPSHCSWDIGQHVPASSWQYVYHINLVIGPIPLSHEEAVFRRTDILSGKKTHRERQIQLIHRTKEKLWAPNAETGAKVEFGWDSVNQIHGLYKLRENLVWNRMGVRKSLLKVSSEVFLSSLDLSWLTQKKKKKVIIQLMKADSFNAEIWEMRMPFFTLHHTSCRYSIVCYHVVVYCIMLWGFINISERLWDLWIVTTQVFSSTIMDKKLPLTIEKKHIFFLLCLTFQFQLHKKYLCSQCVEVWNRPHEPPFVSYFHNAYGFPLENGISMTAESQKAEILPVRKPKY